MRGVLNLNKPIGATSRDVVNWVARPLRKVKVGHAGTLDPLASGVLVVCVGAATRLIEYVQRMPKTYRATIRLGATSDTLDADGVVVETLDPVVPDEGRVLTALATQVGVIEQVPPGYSALKIAGRRAYDMARAGEEVVLAARPVTITRVDLVRYAWPELEIEVDCGGGTYIRSIARDVGNLLGCGGLIAVLTRTRIGGFTLDDAVDPARIDRAAILAALRPSADALGAMPRRTLDADQVGEVLQGRTLTTIGGDVPIGDEVALLTLGGDLLAIAEAVDVAGARGLAPRRVLGVVDAQRSAGAVRSESARASSAAARSDEPSAS